MGSPLVFQLDSFSEGINTWECLVAWEELDLGACQAEFLSPVHLEIEVARAGARFHVRGSVEVTVRQPCVRCLQPVETVVKGQVALLVRAPETRERPGEEPPEGVLFHDGERFDLSDEVRQVIILEVPTHPLCRPDCKGLCPICGTNLNEGDCGCEPPGDPRWDALKHLLGGEREP